MLTLNPVSWTHSKFKFMVLQTSHSRVWTRWRPQEQPGSCTHCLSVNTTQEHVLPWGDEHATQSPPVCLSPLRYPWKNYSLSDPLGFPGGAVVKYSACQCRRHRRHGFDPWFRKIPWRRKWQPTPVFLPGESHGQRSLVGYSPQGCKELDMTEQLSTCTHTLTHTCEPCEGQYWSLYEIGRPEGFVTLQSSSPPSTEIDQRPGKKFRQGLIPPASAGGVRTSTRVRMGCVQGSGWKDDRWLDDPLGGVEGGGHAQYLLLFLTAYFHSGLFKRGSWVSWSLCIFLSIIWPNCSSM